MSALTNFHKHIGQLIKDGEVTIPVLFKETRISKALLYGYVHKGKDPGIDRGEVIAKAAGASLAEMIGNEKPAYAAPREPTQEEKILSSLGAGIDKKRLDIIKFALEGKDAAINVLHRQLPAFAGESSSVSGKKSKGASGA